MNTEPTTCSHCLEDIADGAEVALVEDRYGIDRMHPDCAESYLHARVTWPNGLTTEPS